MNIIEIFILAFSLALDAFAISMCLGLSINKISIREIIKVGLYFGLFQAIMPIIGYLIGSIFKDIIINYDHWIIFILLSIIGINMIKEALSNDDTKYNISFKNMIIYSLVTSIDALSVGITFSFLKVNILIAILIIGIITFILSIIGVIIGYLFGTKYNKVAPFIGGIILILLGIKILLGHLTLTLSIWSMYVILSMILYKDIIFTMYGLLYIINSLIFVITCTSLAFLIGT